jgi:hypothetical protein
MLELINSVYTGIQQLQLQPTKHNVEILAHCFELLEQIAREIAGGQAPEGNAGEDSAGGAEDEEAVG